MRLAAVKKFIYVSHYIISSLVNSNLNETSHDDDDEDEEQFYAKHCTQHTVHTCMVEKEIKINKTHFLAFLGSIDCVQLDARKCDCGD